MVNERNTNPKKKGFKTENDIVEEYNKKYPNDSSLTQGKLSKIKKGLAIFLSHARMFYEIK